LRFRCPPVRQQRDLVKDLEAATAHITRAISAANSQIELIRNFRTRLVVDVVTGKLDVRSVPIEMPEAPIGAIDAGEDMADEAEPVLDEAEEVTVGDE
jgi:type I restriction enzyme, S subunit